MESVGFIVAFMAAAGGLVALVGLLLVLLRVTAPMDVEMPGGETVLSPPPDVHQRPRRGWRVTVERLPRT